MKSYNKITGIGHTISFLALLASDPKRRFARIFLTGVFSAGLLLLLLSSTGYSQAIEDRYVCPSTMTTTIDHNQDVPENPHDDVCESTYITGEVVPDPGYDQYGDPFTSIDGDIINGKPRITLNWKPGWRGTTLVAIIANLKYVDDPLDAINGCDLAKMTMKTYRVTRDDVNPAGTLTAQPYVESVDGNATIDLTYNQGDTRYIGSIESMQLVLEGVVVDDDINATEVSYNTTRFGDHHFKVILTDICNQIHQGPEVTVPSEPTCWNDPAAQSRLRLNGTGMEPQGDNWIRIEPNISYSVTSEYISDFSQHYTLDDNAEDGAITWEGNTFKINKELGSYRIEAVKNAERDKCPTPTAIQIFVGGNNETIPEDGSACAIVLPDDFEKFGFDIDLNDIVLEHFAGIVESQRSITVQPGITLALGAELIIELLPPAPTPEDPDMNMNFIQAIGFDDYGRLMSEGRGYFDGGGKGLQSQSRNLTSGVILATQSINDAYGRPVLSTLPAPVSASTKQIVTNGCDEDEEVGSDAIFTFKPDFVHAADGSIYNHTDFDREKEPSPEPVGNTQPGTLGWYYSENNGTATGDLARLNEPLTPATDYPYSRVLHHQDGSGEIKGSTRPGDAFYAGSDHIATSVNEKVLSSDQYLDHYLTMRADGLGFAKPPSTAIAGEFFRSVAVDENKSKAITYTDKSGAAIISLYFGKGTTPITRSYQFYDNAGRLLVSVSPNGVAEYNGTNFASIDKTSYEYNYKGWLLKMTEADAGTTEYIYRKDGKIRFSQNAEQRKDGSFSYTNYDRSGRPLESGQYKGTETFGTALNGILETIGAGGGLTTGTKSFWLRTYYDEAASILSEENGDPSLNIPLQRTQRFINGAVSCTRNENITTWYSYDERGRAEWMIQKISNVSDEAFSVKTIDYRYGPSGAVEEVVYQKDKDDQFTHYYEYDKDGRLYKLFTTRAKLIYNKEGKLDNPQVLTLQATYYYYLHGPLKRVELENKLQGIDYVYTADGALKAINHHDPSRDPGQDGIDNDFTKDAFGMTLDYYPDDYTSSAYEETGLNLTGYDDQYSGLIKAMRWHGPIEPGKPHAYAFKYDARYQLSEANWATVSNNLLIFNTALNPYRELIGGYDKNGNISSLSRHDNMGLPIADFDYQYEANANKLNSITNSDDDVVRTYEYDDIGRMTYEEKDAEGSYVAYDVSGKVTGVYKVKDESGNYSSPIVKYTYDDRGFRLNKTSFDDDGDEKLITWYVRDPSGNVVSTYEDDLTDTEPLSQTEVPVYAQGRIGVFKPRYNMTFYELSDHLGNVRAVIGDEVEAEYQATMETERSQEEQCATCPFINLQTAPVADYVNHTPTEVTINGTTYNIGTPEAIRLNNGVAPEKSPVGGGIILPVYPGDKINAEVFAKYQNFDNENTSAVTGIASYLASVFGPARSIIDGVNIFNGLDQAPAGVFESLEDVDETLPKAFLTYIVYDRNFVPVKFDYDQVSTAAKIPNAAQGEGDPYMHQHERLALEDLVIEKEGFVYIYVSNVSDQNMEVFFDDLKVTHNYSSIVGGSDYYPFGLVIEDRQITREFYRYGYQGQFAEKDDETGWNHFELREYDPVIGRWLCVDPARQYASPYVAFGNNPINRIDPDGGTDGDPDEPSFSSQMALGFSAWSAAKHSAEAPARVYNNYLRNRSIVESMWAATTDFGGDVVSGRLFTNAWEGISNYVTDYPNSMLKNLDYQIKLGQGEIPVSQVAYDFTYGAWAFAVTKGAGRAIGSINVFGLRGGYGLFGQNGLRLSNYKIEALYANPSAGKGFGTFLSIKQMKPGGALWRWDYGPLHSGGVGVHFTSRFYWQGTKIGSTAQRTWYPPFNPIK